MPRRQVDLIRRVARAIADRRRQLGLTQEAFGERLDLATKNVQRLEAGTQNLTLATLDRIALALETTAAELVAAASTADDVPVGRGGTGTAEAAKDAAKKDAVRSAPTALERLAAAGFAVRPASSAGRRAATAVPLTTIRAAAGSLGGRSARFVEALGWITLPRRGRPPAGQFVAAVEGHSMEPRIPSGALCLFGPPNAPPFGDRIFLVAHASLDEEGLDGPFALKAIAIKKRPNGTRRITLRSLNAAYPPVTIDERAGELRVIAELVDILVPGS